MNASSGFHPFFQRLWRFRYLSLAAAAALLLWNLNYAPVWNPDEGRYVSASLEMIAPFDGSTPDWVVPHLNTLPRLNKPPLVYWCAATLYQIFGVSVANARLVSALAAIGVLLVLWRLGSAMFGEKTGLLAALIWTTCVLPFILARMLSTDMLLAFSMSLAMLGIYQLVAPSKIPAKNSHPARLIGATLTAGIGLGLALLAKGPVGIALPISILIAWLIAVGIQKLMISKRSGSTPNASTPARPETGFNGRIIASFLAALIIAGVLAAPWYLAIGRDHPGFLQKFVFGENIARLTGSTFYHDPKPIWFYLPILIVAILPWTMFLWPVFHNLKASFSITGSTPSAPKTFNLEPTAFFAANRARWFLWLWATAVVALFSISSTKLITYILPALPAIALLIADSFVFRSWPKALRKANGWTIFLLSALALLLPIVFLIPKFFGDKIVPRMEALPLLVLMSGILMLGAFGLWRAHKAAEHSLFATRAASTLVTTGAALFMALTLLISRAAPYEDASAMMIALRPHLQPGDKVVQFKTFQPSTMFYTKSASVIVDFVNTSGLEENQFASSPFFPKDQKVLRQMFQSPHRVFVLVRWKHAHWPTLPPHFQVAANNDYRLLSNRPAPAGFVFNFVAPGKRNRALSPACQAFSPEC